MQIIPKKIQTSHATSIIRGIDLTRMTKNVVMEGTYHVEELAAMLAKSLLASGITFNNEKGQ